MFGIKDNIDFSIVQTTSKDALKRTALIAANYDIKKATEIYEYFIKDIENLPAFDPQPPTTMEQINAFANGIGELSEKYPTITNTVANMLFGMLRNSSIGAYIQPVAEAAATVAEEAPAAPVL